MADPTPLALFWWLSPGFPIGAYAYSHGLEWAAEAGDLRDEAACAAWIRTVLLNGAGRNDAILLVASHSAASARNWEALGEANELALALAPSGELRLETSQQGRSFLDAVTAAWPWPEIGGMGLLGDEVAYPVAVGFATARQGVLAEAAARAYLAALAQNLVSAALRLAPIGQNAGLRILSGLGQALTALAREVLHGDLDEIATSTFRADLGSLRHETQYTRLFRS